MTLASVPTIVETDPGCQPLQGDRILIAYNPVAGSGNRQARVHQLLVSLQQAGYDVKICHETDSLVELAEHYLRTGDLRGIVAAGGDGTLSHVANRVPVDTPLAAFPLGTENLLSRYLNHRSDPESVSALFSDGCITTLDAGIANGRVFTLMAGVGFDADVVQRLHSTRRGHISHWSYVKPILDSIRCYTFPTLTVEINNGDAPTRTVKCAWAFVVNNPIYACGIRIAPHALPCDGKLDVVTFDRGSLFSGIRYLSGIYRGVHLHYADVQTHVATSVNIHSASPAGYQVDGDPGGMLPAEFSCAPRRLRLIVSPSWLAERLSVAK